LVDQATRMTPGRAPGRPTGGVADPAHGDVPASDDL
jgi:hypothetical protein